jgi:hypothetical protein
MPEMPETPNPLQALQLIDAAKLHVQPADRLEFDSLRRGILADTQPVNQIQAEFTNALIRAAWTIRRCDASEADLAAELGMDPLLHHDRRLNRVQRTRTQAQREYRVALRELKRLQTDFAIRQLKENEGLIALPVPIDAKAYIQAARAAGGHSPRQRICFPPHQAALDRLTRQQGQGANAWESNFQPPAASAPQAAATDPAAAA